MPIARPEGDYAITRMYSGPDDAWHLELDVVADQRTLVIAIVPDEDPAREPTVCFNPRGRDGDIPFEVMRWFMNQVEGKVSVCRAWMQLRPDLVKAIHRLRQEYVGAIDDDDFPDELAKLRITVPEDDLPAVLAAAFGRNPDGTTTTDTVQAPRPANNQGHRT
ncbi:hypothetical protein ACFO3J_26765 [Streptomyces polygonati]|uniref:Uncharacterized protein n=1 Tax=Streptomyces polygonati TaxID=1617087 RepID=A0ABV8HTM6_9ACTN